MNLKLVDARKAMGLTVASAAAEMGISHGMLSMLENRKRRGGDSLKIRVATFYNVSVQELFYN